MWLRGVFFGAIIAYAGAAPLEGVIPLELVPTDLTSDTLAAEGLVKLQQDIMLGGYPNSKKCTLANVAYRREW